MMDVREIKEYLAHRYPFLLIDRVLEVHPGEKVVAIKNVTINEPFFEGHFPGNPVMPGVLITEAMTQCAGILGFKTMGQKPEDGKIYMYVGSDKLRFKKTVVPGDQLRLEASIITNKRGIWKFDTKATVDGELVCSGIMICAEG